MPESIDLIAGEDGRSRCWWCGTDPTYELYHDREWGMPVDDDRRIFEKVCLEGFQSGLSWLTILRKRDSFRDAFEDFEMKKVKEFDQSKIDQLLRNAAIVRHLGKIRSTINNAARGIELADEFGSLAKFFWSFEPSRQKSPRSRSDITSMSDQSTHLSKSLKQRGWTFVGPTTCYAMMQAMGIVNDHLEGCTRWEAVHRARKSFRRP